MQLIQFQFTRTAETTARYAGYFSTVSSWFPGTLLTGDLTSHEEFHHWLAQFVADKRPASRKWIKAAVTYTYRALGLSRQFIEEFRKSCLEWPEPPKNLPIRTSRFKAKYLRDGDLDALLLKLGELGEAADLTILLCVATTIVGLRPCEWFGARMTRSSLIVRNAKASNGRAHGEFRTLHLDRLYDDQIEVLQALFSILPLYTSSKTDWARTLQRVRRMLSKAGAQCFPRRKRRPTLYTFRHFFIASLKRSGYARTHIAALSGHVATRTAFNHYARASGGSRGMRLVADQGDVSKVRDNYSKPFEVQQNANPAPTLDLDLGL